MDEEHIHGLQAVNRLHKPGVRNIREIAQLTLKINRRIPVPGVCVFCDSSCDTVYLQKAKTAGHSAR